MRGANDVKTERARQLRQQSTKAELKLWNSIRSRSINGHKFVRQEPIGPYVVDFICRAQRLIVEVDGGQHATDPRDASREQWLIDRGYRIVRFWNNDVMDNIEGVLESLAAALAEGPPHPGSLRDPTSPRLRGEVTRGAGSISTQRTHAAKL